jgi:neurofibromin 1
LKFPESTTQAIGAFVFLRFFNCAISMPDSYGILANAPTETTKRGLLLVSKLLQTLSIGA